MDKSERIEDLVSKALRRGIPAYCVDGIVHYVVTGRPVGDFLERVLSNDLMGALGKADDTNANLLRNYGMFLYNDVPMGCWGSPETYESWIERGGEVGREKEAS